MKQSMSRRVFGTVVGAGVVGMAVPRQGSAQTVPRTPIIIKSGSLRILSAVELVESTAQQAQQDAQNAVIYTASLGAPARIDYLDLDDDLDVQPDEQDAGQRTVEFSLPRTFGADEKATLEIGANGSVTLTVPQRLQRLGGGGNRYRYRLNKNASEVRIRAAGGAERRGRFKNAMIVVKTE